MLTITGKILMIESKEFFNSKQELFNKVFLVIVKQMKGVKRNICFESYGKVAKDILNYRNGERIRVHFTIDSIIKKERWYHTLKVIEVEKEIKKEKTENTNQINLINYDTTEKSFE
jgi:formylmethanofuran dehydrogenase subunit E